MAVFEDNNSQQKKNRGTRKEYRPVHRENQGNSTLHNQKAFSGLANELIHFQETFHIS